MKFAAAYYLLLLYATIIVKPIIPVAEDILVHCFAEAHHIATVHAVEGKNHVEKEMAKSGNDDTSSKKQKTDKTEQAIHEIAIDNSFNLLSPNPLKNIRTLLNISLWSIYIDFANPPPRIII